MKYLRLLTFFTLDVAVIKSKSISTLPLTLIEKAGTTGNLSSLIKMKLLTKNKLFSYVDEFLLYAIKDILPIDATIKSQDF
jgi:hypothetical protein